MSEGSYTVVLDESWTVVRNLGWKFDCDGSRTVD